MATQVFTKNCTGLSIVAHLTVGHWVTAAESLTLLQMAACHGEVGGVRVQGILCDDDGWGQIFAFW